MFIELSMDELPIVGIFALAVLSAEIYWYAIRPCAAKRRKEEEPMGTPDLLPCPKCGKTENVSLQYRVRGRIHY